jgi:hypothetical protein
LSNNGHDWARIWRNLHTAWITDTLKSTWHTIIYDLIPTTERLTAIRLASSNKCDMRKGDMLILRLTNAPTARNLEMDMVPPGSDPPDRSAVHSERIDYSTPFPPLPQRHSATVWIIAHLVWYITNERRLSLTVLTSCGARCRTRIKRRADCA